jgi:hypothetical protein
MVVQVAASRATLFPLRQTQPIYTIFRGGHKTQKMKDGFTHYVFPKVFGISGVVWKGTWGS